MKTLENFLKKHDACSDGFEFAKDLTFEQFLNTCERGDWILWLFARTNPDSLREITLVRGHCANTVRHLMEDERSLKAIDTAIAFGEGRATRKELEDAAAAASVATWAPDTSVATWAAYAWGVADWTSAHAAYAAAYDVVYARGVYAYAPVAAYAAYDVAKKQNQKLTADICRKYLPLEIWNQSEI